MLPVRIELGVALGTVSALQILTALGTEVHHPSGGECPIAAATVGCRRLNLFLRARGLLGTGLPLADRIARRKGQVRGRIGDPGHCILVQIEYGLLLSPNEAEVRIGAFELGGELQLDLIRIGSGQAGFAGTQTHKGDLIILAGFQLQSPAVDPIWQDPITDVAQFQRASQPRRIGGPEVKNELAEEPLQIGHGSIANRQSTGNAGWNHAG
jgi:hypothetical protein